MQKVTQIIVKRFWGLCALLLISLAVVVTIGRELAPQAGNYRADVEAYLSEVTGLQVSIESLAAGWEGLSPELTLRGVRIIDSDGDDILSVDTAFAELSLLRSLFNWQLALGKVEVVNIAMGFQQNADGIWGLNGLDPTVADVDFSDPLDIFLLVHHIEFRNAQFSFDFRTGHSSEVELPHLVLENSGDFHRLRSEVAVDRNRDVLSLIIEARGDPRNLDNFTAKGHLRLQRFELDKAVAALPGEWWDGLPEQEWRKGHQLDLEAWFDISAGMAITTHGRLDIGELPVSLQESVVTPERTVANFAGHWAKSGAWKLAFGDVSLEWDGVQAPPINLVLSSANLGEPVYLQTEQIDLAGWFTTARIAGLLKGEVLDAFESLQPRGQLRNLELRVAGTRLRDLTLRANLEDVSADSWKGAPAVTKLNGYLETTPVAGFVDIASNNGFSMYYPTLHRHELEFERAGGRVHWQIDLEEAAIRVHSGLLSVSGETGEGRGYVSLFVPFEFGSRQEELIIQAGLRHSALGYHRQFVPYILPDSLTGWLSQSVGEGKVSSGGFVYRGGFTSESVRRAAIQLFLNVEGADLTFHPKWPALQQTNGVFWLDDMTILADLNSGRLFNAQVRDTKVRLTPPLDGAQLTLDIAGRARGNAADGLRLVRETPLGKMIGTQLFADWSLNGDMQAWVDLSIPLQEGRKPIIRQVDVDLRNTRLATGDLQLQFDDIQGRVSYNDQQGVYAERLTGQFWRHPITATVSRTMHDDTESLVLSLTGATDIQSLREWSPRPELQFLEGRAAYQVSLMIPNGQSGKQPVLTLESDLHGVAVDLPQPFGKAAEDRRALVINAPLQAGDVQYYLRYDHNVHASASVRDGQLIGAALGLGKRTDLEQRVLAVRGTLDHFDLGEWQAVLDRYKNYRQSAGDSVALAGHLRPVIDVHFNTVTVNDFSTEDLALKGRQTADHWQLAMDSPFIAGDVRLYVDSKQPIVVDLDHLRLPGQEPPEPRHPFLPPPESTAATDLLADIDPSTLPAMDFAVREFWVGDADYGTWSFRLRPTYTGLMANEIVGNVRGGRITGMQAGEGAELWWDRIDGEDVSRFNGRFVTANLGSALQQWDQPRLLDSESSEFEARLNWPGSPAAITVTVIQGDIVMAIKRGTFIRGAGEASTGSALLELIAFFNFDTWLRRLRLDFSDLSRAGTSFETINGALQFDQGKVYMNTPVVVNSHSSRFQMAGVLDLVESELDTRLIATIPVGGNLTFVAALAGMGLPAVAGMWLISKVFEEQIGKMSSLSFNVTGPLDDPEMDFVRLFDDDAMSEGR
ncbi:MAG: YhdP family protein [Cellvibrionaceae bacterium]